MVEDPGGLEDVLVAELRGLHHAVWGVWALGVADFLVPGLEVGVTSLVADDVQVGQVISRSSCS